MIERDLGIPIYQAQIDLRMFLHQLGCHGGLQRIARQWGIYREDEIAGLTGFDAVLLWARYRHGDAAALQRLIAYNRADVVNLEVLLKRGYELARDQVRAAADTTVPARVGGKVKGSIHHGTSESSRTSD
jgi:uncharacterized protein YprB with RNaseH-like and TPR domain